MNKANISLLKIFLLQNFDFRRKDKIKNASLFIPLILFFILGSFLSLIYSFMFSFFLVDAGKADSLNLVLYAMTGISSMIAVVTGITKVKGTLFGGNDYDLLASLPIPKKNIIFVKFISLYLVQLFYTTIFVVPATLVTVVMGTEPLWLIDGLCLLIFSPVVPLFVAGALGMLLGLISDRFRFGNLISILFYALFLGAIMYSSFILNSSDAEEMDPTNIINLLTIFGWFNPTTKLLTLNVILLNDLVYLCVNGLILIALIFVFAKCYDYFHFLMTSFKTHRKYVQKEMKPKGVFKALFSLDLKRYFTSKMYLMNTITGGIMCLLLTIIMIVSFSNIKDPEAMEILAKISPYFILINVWCVGMAVPSAVAINFEGKNMWQMKVLPISYKQYSFSKILLSYLVLAPFVLISSGIWIIYMEKTVLNILLTFILPQVYLFSMSLIGFLINTYFYKLKWSNEMEAVKNSAGMVISMLIDFAYTLVLCGVFVLPGVFGFFELAEVLTILVVIAVSVLCFILVSRVCEKSINNIEC